MTQLKLESEGWRVGRRVQREDSDDLGVIVDEKLDGRVKVRWDNGCTSYFKRTEPSNVKLKDDDEAAAAPLVGPSMSECEDWAHGRDAVSVLQS